MEHGDVRPEIAMVSRLRVEVRGESMKAAEEVAFAMLDHARLAGVLEGFVPSRGSYSDHFFNRPEVTRKWDEQPEPWGELGLAYGGRLSFVFEPESVYGGLKQFGVNVTREEDGPPYTGSHLDHGYIVLNRVRPVTRDHSWEDVTSMLVAAETGEAIIEDIRSIRDVTAVEASLRANDVTVLVEMDGWENVSVHAETLQEAAAKARKIVCEMLDAAQASDEEIIDNIERLVGVAHVTVREIGPTSWRVLVLFSEEDGRVPVEGRGETKREAALNAYGLSGVEVTHFDTTRPASHDDKSLNERIAGV